MARSCFSQNQPLLYHYKNSISPYLASFRFFLSTGVVVQSSFRVMHRAQSSSPFLWHFIYISAATSQPLCVLPCMTVELSVVLGRAFICLHKSHDVRGLGCNESAFLIVVGGIANCLVEVRFGSGSSIFDQGRSWQAEADLVRKVFELR